MALSPKLVLRQSQSLAMTPQLLQAIKLLQLSTLDLEAFVAAEVEKNPLLEQTVGEVEPSPADGFTPDEPPLDRPRADASSDPPEPPDVDPSDLFPDVYSGPGSADAPLLGSWTGARRGSADEAYDFENAASGERSLSEHLSEQLALAGMEPDRRLIGGALIGLVDEAGYLRDPPAEIAERLGVAETEVRDVLRLLKTFDPPGVFARDLAECLALQLIDRNRFDPAMQALVGRLDLVARRNFSQLRRICGVDEEDLSDMLAELKALNPKPGAAFGGVPAQTFAPDVIVRGGPDGGWRIDFNPDALPRVLVDRSYYARVADRARDAREKAYLSDCLQSANWLVKSLDQRARTILKVATEIVRRQEAFLSHGVRGLKPLNLKSVADAIGMHESTVSRVTANKAMATPRGVFEMKYFFTSAIAASGGGEAHSAEAVRHRIRRMIENESPDDVLSDDVIVRRLRADGVDIARRTVAKYRESMRIPSSVQRRREKMLGRVRPTIDSERRPS